METIHLQDNHQDFLRIIGDKGVPLKHRIEYVKLQLSSAYGASK